MKKKLFFLLSIILVFFTISVSAEMQFIQINADNPNTKPDLHELAQNYYLTRIGDLDYFINWNGKHSPIKYDKNVFNFLVLSKNYGDYIWTGEYYYARSNVYDYAPSTVWNIDPKYTTYAPLCLFDENLNLVKKVDIPTYVLKIGYHNGVYYYYAPMNPEGQKFMQSTDFENWTGSEEGVIPQSNDKVAYLDDSLLNVPMTEPYVALNKLDFNKVAYENEVETLFCCQAGEWIVKKDKANNLYLSNDDIYFIKIKSAREEQSFSFRTIYEKDENLVIVLNHNSKSIYFSVPKQQVYAELEAQKEAPYVKVADEILGFETPPVTESDRTLVPMRFLFEKLGAEVSWDQETETATAQKANTVLSFSIDQNSAVVNGQPVTMDVPARLVNDKTMVPLRFLSENLGYTVEWDEATRMATIKE